MYWYANKMRTTLKLLTNLTTISSCLAVTNTRFNRNKNVFEMSAKIFKNIKMSMLLLISLLRVYLCYWASEYFEKERGFVVSACIFLFFLFLLLVMIGIIYVSITQDYKILATLNELMKTKTEIEMNLKSTKNTLLEILFLCTLLLELILVFSFSIYYIFIEDIDSLLDVTVTLVFLYFNTVGCLCIGRYCLTINLISNCFQILDNACVVSNKILQFHEKLYNLAIDTSNSFSAIILFYIGLCFYQLTARAIQVYYKLAYNTDDEPNFLEIVDLASVINKFLWIIYFSSSCMNRANLLTNNLLRRYLQIKARQKFGFVRACGLQMLHEKLELRAGGFFIVNQELIFYIISGCCTYIVILIQFLNYEHKFNYIDMVLVDMDV